MQLMQSFHSYCNDLLQRHANVEYVQNIEICGPCSICLCNYVSVEETGAQNVIVVNK